MFLHPFAIGCTCTAIRARAIDLRALLLCITFKMLCCTITILRRVAFVFSVSIYNNTLLIFTLFMGLLLLTIF